MAFGGGSGGGGVTVIAVVGRGGILLLLYLLALLCLLFWLCELWESTPLPYPTPPPPGPRTVFFPRTSQTLFSFEADATSLVPDVFSLGFEDEYEELEADLQEFSEKFADSPAAQVRALACSCGRVLRSKFGPLCVSVT